MKQSPGFRFIIDDLKIMSPAGRKFLYDRKIMTSTESIESESDKLEKMVKIVKKADKSGAIDRICSKLNEFRDIDGTISRLNGFDTLDDIELFEIKHFAILIESIREEITEVDLNFFELPALTEVLVVLDPENRRIPHFYIYSLYSQELTELREQIKLNYGTDDHSQLFLLEQQLEQQIREGLSGNLGVQASELRSAFEKLAELDVMIALAQQALEMGFCKSSISRKITDFKSVFNPAVKKYLEDKNKKFQPVDINFGSSPTLLTGANMGGKTILLNSIFICQNLFQFGFFVPAVKALIVPVDDIVFSREQNTAEQSGLSSFAAEMLNINTILKDIKSGKKVLALIDEPARTTNPEEGKAIVNALIEILEEYEVRALVTTHYSGIKTKGHRLRVKGLKTEDITGKVDLRNLNDRMDYSLVSHEDTDVPAEGLRIAEIMGIDAELISRARKNFLS